MVFGKSSIMLRTKRRFQSLRRVFRWSSATSRHLRHPNRPPEPAIAPACLFIGRSSSIALAATSTSDHDAPGQRKSQEAQARQAKGQASYPQTEDAAAGRCPRQRTQCRAPAAAGPKGSHKALTWKWKWKLHDAGGWGLLTGPWVTQPTPRPRGNEGRNGFCSSADFPGPG